MLSIKGNLRLYVGLPDCVDNFKNGVNNGFIVLRTAYLSSWLNLCKI